MSRLILVRHAHSCADDVNEKLRSDPLYTRMQEWFRSQPYHPATRVLAIKLHHKYRLPCDVNESGLTPTGIEQARNLGTNLKTIDIGYCRAWCSPLARAKETLQHLTATFSEFSLLSVTFDDNLVERQRGAEAGIFANLRLYLAAHPSENRRKQRESSLRYSPPGGESLLNVLNRAQLFLRRTSSEFLASDTLIVAHHVIISAIRSHIEGWRPEEFLMKLVSEKSRNCGFVVYVR